MLMWWISKRKYRELENKSIYWETKAETLSRERHEKERVVRVLREYCLTLKNALMGKDQAGHYLNHGGVFLVDSMVDPKEIKVEVTKIIEPREAGEVIGVRLEVTRHYLEAQKSGDWAEQVAEKLKGQLIHELQSYINKL